MPVYFLRRHRKGVNSDGRGHGKKLRGVGRGETVIRISKKIACYYAYFILIYSYEIYILFFSRLVTWDIYCYIGFLIISMQKYNRFFIFLTLWINLFLRVVS